MIGKHEFQTEILYKPLWLKEMLAALSLTTLRHAGTSIQYYQTSKAVRYTDIH